MRVAWFRAGSSTSVEIADATAAVTRVLAGTIALDVITESGAHHFVVEQALRPYDVCVFEPRNDPASDFIWAYLFSYPGVLLLQDRSLHDSRVRTFERHRRVADYAREFEFNNRHASRATARAFARGTWPMLRAPIQASRLVAVTDNERRLALEADYPGARIRVVPPAAANPFARGRKPLVEPHSDAGRSAGGTIRVGAVGSTPRALVTRAVERARALGSDVMLIADQTLDAVAAHADVLVVLDAPAEDARLGVVLACMAHGTPVIVFERESTAAWPALDPQTWHARDAVGTRAPVVVSIDPRDEEHSLMLALRGLADDAARRQTLGAAGRTWWLAHGTPEYAASVWRRLLEEAVATPPPVHPPNWPAHLSVDGTGQARAIADQFGITLPLP